jgi:tyrosyl-tRNA synthetase
MKINTNPKKIEELLTRGAEVILVKESLKKKLKSGEKLRIKYGIDPTGPKIHLGRAFQFLKLRAFQELGHQIVLIIGDFTAQIGDASDKTAIRRALSEKEVKENIKGYEKQIGKILDLNKTEIHYNSEWLDKLSAKNLISLSMHFSAQQMIQRRNFKERWDDKKPIGLHELSYPVFQGYDSVQIKADVEIGGSDQLFNLKIGRALQRIFNQPAQDIMTSKMLSGIDGRKMSTSWGNIITMVDSPDDMYGRIMALRDELMPEYFELCTYFPAAEIKRIEKNLKEKNVNPRDIKSMLAKATIAIYYGENAASAAEEEFEKVFKRKKFPRKISEIQITMKKMPLLDLLVGIKLASSKAAAKRLILQKGVRIDKNIQEDWQAKIEIKKGLIVQVGKRKFVKIS